ncbi:MAG: stage II sporulation protein M, partial [Zoogloeaceae bacterium]|nr:stage II sporulation protein M [Zoogloeaceae bacterium]
MKESQFVALREVEWLAWDIWLGRPKRPESKRGTGFETPHGDATEITPENLPSAFRRLCHDVSLARDRRYSSVLIDALQQRVLAAHQRVYGARGDLRGHWLDFFSAGLPRLVRAERRFVLASALLFFAPLLLCLWLAQIFPESVYYFLEPEVVARFMQMYAPETKRPGALNGIAAEGQLAMLMFYIGNNVRIDFQCFAGGILFGVGSAFFLVYNGLVIGMVAGLLTAPGYTQTFWGFVAGHSGPELIGAVLSGAAGLKIGYALIAPGRLRRREALAQAARGAVRLLYGAAFLTFCAAFVEALWSPLRGLPFALKIGA